MSSGAWSLPQPQGAQRSPATGRNVSRIGEPPQEALRADFSGVRSVAFGGGPRFAALGTRVAPRKSSEPPVSSFHRFEVWSRRKSRGPRSVAALNRRIPAPSWRFRIPSLPPATMSCPRALPGTPLRPRTPHRCPTTGRASDLRAAVCWLLACVLLTGCAAGRNRAHAKQDEAVRLAERARLAEDRGDAAEAEQLMTAAVRSNPLDCENRLALSEIQLERGSLDKASAHLRRLVAQNPEDPRIYVRLAQTEFLRGDAREAEVWLDRGLELDPHGEQALMLKGRLAELRQRPDEATLTYFRVLDANPENLDARLRLARLMIERDEPARAAPLLRDVAQHESSRPEQVARARWMLGETHVLAGRYTDAATEMGRASRTALAACRRLVRARIGARTGGDVEGAVAALDRSLELEPASTPVRQLRDTLTAPAGTRLAAGERVGRN